jgi:3'-phosphoadenosine 5'-phosphosulfate sulfotransferase (PAPS reductase)/FAD synthetase
MKKILPICSVSGGKDSTLLYCLMVEQFGQDFIPIFADTGHEHPVTLNYVRNLHIMAGGPPVQFVRADFQPVITKRRRYIEDQVHQMILDGGSVQDIREKWRLANRTYPTGETFLDLMIWKGRAPSTKAQFCTEHLKLWPIKFFLMRNYPQEKFDWVMYTGIRAGESHRRSLMQPFSWNGFFDCLSVLPCLYNTEEEQFQHLEYFGVPPNPLYALGYGRVGCFPCIHANKTELSLIPDWAWDRLNHYESSLKRSWFPAGFLPGMPDGYIPCIAEVREWCRTSHGGRQYNMFRTAPEDAPSCMTGWIACE